MTAWISSSKIGMCCQVTDVIATLLHYLFGNDSQIIIVWGDPKWWWLEQKANQEKKGGVISGAVSLAEKFKVKQSEKKLMATVSWDAVFALFRDFIYCIVNTDITKHLAEAVCWKRTWYVCSSVILLNDNAILHMVNLTKECLQKDGLFYHIHYIGSFWIKNKEIKLEYSKIMKW